MWILLDSSTVVPKQQLQQEEVVVVVVEEEETPVLEKQSPLNGFQGFLSKLPPMQHEFSPEPAEYTLQRESRRDAIKQSFLHGWNGYS